MQIEEVTKLRNQHDTATHDREKLVHELQEKDGEMKTLVSAPHFYCFFFSFYSGNTG